MVSEVGFRAQGLHSIILCSLMLPGGQESLTWPSLIYSDGKGSACNAGDAGLIPGSGRSHEGNRSALQYSCLENSMDRGAWQATDHGVTKSWARLGD